MAQQITRENAEDILKNVDNFLFDCDGVLWDGTGTINGSLETVLRLKELGKRVFYVTNNSSQTRDHYVKKCASYGFPAEKNEILCTAYIAAEYLHKANFKDKVYLIGKEESIGVELDNVGIRYTGPGPDPIEGTTYADWLENIKLDPEVKCVLVGFDPHMNYMKMIRAASYLKKPDCLYIATNEDTTFPVKCVLVGFDPHLSYMKMIRAASYLKKPDCIFLATNEDESMPVKNSDICIPGTGCMVKPVSLASGRQPIVMGKPTANMFEVLRKVHNVDPARSMMVGDRLDTDIMFAKQCGMRSLLVFSGISSIDDIQHRPEDSETAPDSQPDYFAENLAGLGTFI